MGGNGKDSVHIRCLRIALRYGPDSTPFANFVRRNSRELDGAGSGIAWITREPEAVSKLLNKERTHAQVRAIVLNFLATDPKVTRSQLIGRLQSRWVTEKQIHAVLEELVSDGLITTRDRMIRLRNGEKP